MGPLEFVWRGGLVVQAVIFAACILLGVLAIGVDLANPGSDQGFGIIIGVIALAVFVPAILASLAILNRSERSPTVPALVASVIPPALPGLWCAYLLLVGRGDSFGLLVPSIAVTFVLWIALCVALARSLEAS